MDEPSFLSSTRTAYDTIATAYVERFNDELVAKPLDRAFLATFAELVHADSARLVVDLGCGPGLVTAHLHSLGLDVSGIDLSPHMIAHARRAHPELHFDEGSMTSSGLGEGTLGGLVAWYSTIHIPTDLLPSVFEEFHRILAPGGYALLAFQVGDERRHLTEWFGHEVELDLYLRTPDRVAGLLRDAGFAPVAEMLREAGELERLPRACLLVRKPAASTVATEAPA